MHHLMKLHFTASSEFNSCNTIPISIFQSSQRTRLLWYVIIFSSSALGDIQSTTAPIVMPLPPMCTHLTAGQSHIIIAILLWHTRLVLITTLKDLPLLKLGFILTQYLLNYVMPVLMVSHSVIHLVSFLIPDSSFNGRWHKGLCYYR